MLRKQIEEEGSVDVETRDLIEEKLREIYVECDKPLKSGWIKSRKVGGGRDEDYIDGAYVIKMLNHLFPCGWSKHIKSINILDESENSRGNAVITAECHMILKIHPWGEVLIEQEDVGSVEMFAPTRGSAMSNARKGAVTDALKRCAKSLGNSFGLALSMDPVACKAVGAVENSKQNDPSVFKKEKLVTMPKRTKGRKIVEGEPEFFDPETKSVINSHGEVIDEGTDPRYFNSHEEVEENLRKRGLMMDSKVIEEPKKGEKFPWLDASVREEMTKLYKQDKEKPINGRLKSKIINACTSAIVKVRDMVDEDAEEMVCSLFEDATNGVYSPSIGLIPSFLILVDEELSVKS